MKTFFCVTVAAIFCAAILVPLSTAANPTTPKPANGPNLNGSLNTATPSVTPIQQDLICNNTGLANICPAAGPGDDPCKQVATSVNGTNATCMDIGACGFLILTQQVVVTKKVETAGHTKLKTCLNGENIYTKP